MLSCDNVGQVGHCKLGQAQISQMQEPAPSWVCVNPSHRSIGLPGTGLKLSSVSTDLLAFCLYWVFLRSHSCKFQIRTFCSFLLHSEAIRVLFLVLSPRLELLPMPWTEVFINSAHEWPAWETLRLTNPVKSGSTFPMSGLSGRHRDWPTLSSLVLGFSVRSRLKFLPNLESWLSSSWGGRCYMERWVRDFLQTFSCMSFCSVLLKMSCVFPYLISSAFMYILWCMLNLAFVKKRNQLIFLRHHLDPLLNLTLRISISIML